MTRKLLFSLLLGTLTLGPWTTGPAHAQDSVELPPVQFGSLRETLRGVTRESGNAGFGDLIAGLTALEVATAPLGSPATGIIYRYVDDPNPLRQTLTFAPLLLGRATTIGRSTAMFGANIARASYDSVSGRSLGALPIASFQGPAPIVTSSTLDLSVETLTVIGFATFGLTNDLDVGVAVPVVGVTLGGSQVQREAAIGSAIFPIDASSVGVGDIAVTGQYRVLGGSNAPDGLSARVTLRAPTGDADDLRGIDTWRAMVSGTGSRGFGRFSVHGTAGYEYWNQEIPLQNTLPANVVETWRLKNQLQVGAGFEFAANPAITVAFEALWRRVGQAGQLDLRSLAAPAPGVGIESAQLLGVGPGGLEKTLIVPGVSIRVTQGTLLTLRAMVSLDDTGMRDEVTPMVGLSWALCDDC